jgi:survival-of-motor-neuron-related-splicing factor 30
MTAQAELETYQVQLEQVELALQSDPDNSELSSLRTSLQELISLTQQSLGASAAASSSRKATVAPAASTHVWSAGDECLAKYSEDWQWYPARIISIAGSTEKRVYSVTFKGYDSTEPVDGSALKPLPAGHAASSYAAGSKRKLNKKVEVRAQKAKEQNSKQQTWQKFAKKSEKKGIHIAGTSGTSIFKTPDNPMGKGMSVLSITLARY